MRAKVIYTVGALLAGVLLIWSCDTETNTGGLDSPCSSDSECGSGLVCAVARCSDRSAGRPCMIDKQCGGGLICNGAVCGGAAGEFCRADANCAEGLICAEVNSTRSECTASSGMTGDPCGDTSHCDDSLVCQDGTCGMREPGGLGSACTASSECDNSLNLICGNNNMCGGDEGYSCGDDNVCAGNFICASSVGGGQACASSNGTTGDPCRIGNDDHCDGALVCGNDGTCGIRQGDTCVIGDDLCAGSLVCTGVIGNQVCASSTGVRGSVCGIDNHCNIDDGLVCSSGTCLVGSGNTCSDDDQCAVSLRCNEVMGSLQCSTAGNGAIGSACGFPDHCTTADATCSSGTCLVTSGGTCTGDDQCDGSLLCTGTTGSLTCTSSDGSTGRACRIDDHCTGTSTTCSSGTCLVTSGGTCTGDDQCDGSLLCTGVLGGLTCNSSDGSIGSACSVGTHCMGTDGMGAGATCDGGICKVTSGGTCTGDNQCAGSLSCTGAANSRTCTQAASGVVGSACSSNTDCTATGTTCESSTSTCRIADGGTCTGDDQCVDSLLCTGVVGSLTCSSSDGSIGSTCSLPTHCTTADATCSNGVCKVVSGGACTADNQCDGGNLRCTGASGSQTCTSRGNGELMSVCGIDSHCTGNNLVCSDGTCKLTSGNTCTAVGQCTGDLLCIGIPDSRTCSMAGDGALGSVCGFNVHCNAADGLVCSSGMCKLGPGGGCTADNQCDDGLICSTSTSTCQLADSDGDSVLDNLDVDDDNDGLIEIASLLDLHNMRHNLAGTSFKDSASATGVTAGAPTTATANCTTATSRGVYLCGYELTRNLDFDIDDDDSTYTGTLPSITLDSGDNHDTYFPTANGGWAPIRNFNAIFEGNGHTISNLAIDRSEDDIGLFGSTSSGSVIRNIGLTGGVVNGEGEIGSLVGFNIGTITASYATGSASGRFNVGGLVGRNAGPVTASYATGSVSGDNHTGGANVGGLVGLNNGGTITASYATGSVGREVDGFGTNLGGLVGQNDRATIIASYATGNVSTDFDPLGGLVGSNVSNGIITDSYGFGTVNGAASTATPTGVSAATGLTLANAGTSWNSAASNTAGAWEFATGVRPKLRYADYDGSTGTVFVCSMFPATVTCGTTQLPGQ